MKKRNHSNEGKKNQEPVISEDDFKDDVVDEGFQTSNQRSKKEEEKKEEAVSNKTQLFCRFCWDAANSIEDPLLSVCRCKGGVGFLHFNCLKRWLATKMTQIRTQVSVTYFWKSFGCEICHSIYPYVFKAHGIKYSLIDIPKPTDDYIILESLTLERSTSRMVQILMPILRNHSFKLGRGLDQEVRISDISVSRYHAKIKFLEDKFVLEDNLSKFGTLVLVRNQLDVYPGQFRQL